MHETISTLRHFAVHASDGDIGQVADVLFDDETWTARYFVVETGGWLRSRRVLVSPIAVSGLDEHARSVSVDLTKDQFAGSPSIDTDVPLSRQMEMKYRDYFSWPLYWVDTFLEAYRKADFPKLATADQAVHAGHTTRRESLLPHPPKGDPHLRSANKVIGYTVMASDGGVGPLEDLLIDSNGWGILSLVVHANQLTHSRRLIVSVNHVGEINWPTSSIHLGLSRGETDALLSAPTSG